MGGDVMYNPFQTIRTEKCDFRKERENDLTGVVDYICKDGPTSCWRRQGTGREVLCMVDRGKA